ncbi:M24 family metallopeptidase [Shouchella shacheensis]|uniref:M24 family metallopeptidase n=1 Tax=Shouchella shacheensis TaxID=1649580 RepID=UPI00073FB31C|nr:Xaa-Pro peptidase family protein [Shouchella shacheensis]
MSKLTALRKRFSEQGIDSLLVASGVNRQYLSGFTGSSGALLITEMEAIFITDFRYTEQAASEVKEFIIVKQEGTLADEVAKQAKNLDVSKLGFEKAQLTYADYDQYKGLLPGMDFVPVTQMVESLRLVKTKEELSVMQKAADIADNAFAHIQSVIRPGIAELDVANELEFFMRKQGAASSSFDIIVASGYRSALPHGTASEKKIESGELVTLDFGAYYNGYCSDITRTLAVGEISGDLHTIYETVRVAQELGMNGIKPGMTGKEADALTRDYIREKGYGNYFGHSTGHGLGMEVHEGPGLSVKSEVVLEPGMVVTVEPGIYIPGVGGTRIEDDIVITEEGIRSLTHSTKELLHVGK